MISDVKLFFNTISRNIRLHGVEKTFHTCYHYFIPVIQHFLFMSLIGRSTDLSGKQARPTRLLSLAGVLSFNKAMSLLMPNGFL